MGYEIVTSTGSNNTVTAVCTSPRKVLAGGCSFDVNGYRSSAPIQQYRIGGIVIIHLVLQPRRTQSARE